MVPTEDRLDGLNPQAPQEQVDEEGYVSEYLPFWEKVLGPVAITSSFFAVLLGTMFFIVVINVDKEIVFIETTADEKVEEPPEEPELDVEENPVEIPLEDKISDILVKNVEVSEHLETADNVDFHEAKGEPDNASMVDFENPSPSGIIGLEGAPSGTKGDGRGGRVNSGPPNGRSKRTEDAVIAALLWLKRHQENNGSWSLTGYNKQCGTEGKKGKCDGFGEENYDVGATGLAMLAYTGRGLEHQTPDKHGFHKVIERGLKFMKGVQKSDGAFGEEKGNFLYNQTLATLALGDLLSMSEDESIRPYVESGVKYILDAQNPGMAWRYHNYKTRPERKQDPEVNGELNDTSVTTWAVMALKTAKGCGIQVDPKGYEGASAWLDSVFDGSGYNQPGTFGYTKKKSFVHRRPFATTACGMLSRQFMHQDRGVSAGAETLLLSLPNLEGVRDMYYWYYGSLAMFQLGGEHWGKWNTAMKNTLTKSQHNKRHDCLYGSWDPHGETWGDMGGRVYTTATGALTLEVYYRYVREKKEAEKAVPINNPIVKNPGNG